MVKIVIKDFDILETDDKNEEQIISETDSALETEELCSEEETLSSIDLSHQANETRKQDLSQFQAQHFFVESKEIIRSIDNKAKSSENKELEAVVDLEEKQTSPIIKINRDGKSFITNSKDDDPGLEDKNSIGEYEESYIISQEKVEDKNMCENETLIPTAYEAKSLNIDTDVYKEFAAQQKQIHLEQTHQDQNVPVSKNSPLVKKGRKVSTSLMLNGYNI